jgi:hypothetical protein
MRQKYHLKTTLFNILLMTLIMATLPSMTWAKGRIKDVRVDIVGEALVVSADLAEAFNDGIIRDIHNGIPKEFYYYILLKRKENRWFDEEVRSKTVRYTVKYDTLKKDYHILLNDGEKIVEQHRSDIEQMKQFVSQIDQVQFSPAKVLGSSHRYYISVKSQMKAAKLPFYLDYFLFFIPFLEIDTPWADSPFIIPDIPK